MDEQKSAEAKVAAAHAANGPNTRSRTGAKHSMRDGGADRRAEKSERPGEASGGTAHGPDVGRQARAACGENAGDGIPELMEEVLRRENMLAALKRVVRNGGAPGIDGMTVEDLAHHCYEHWTRIREELLHGTYVPAPVRKVEIPKPDGKGTRMLGIPTVLDRMIQQALLQVLQPIFDPTFSDASFRLSAGKKRARRGAPRS